jgi:hypothetical protein
MKVFVRFTVIIALPVLIFLSCEPDPANQFPVIEITSPVLNQHFEVPDTIHIEADISDDEGLSKIKVGLVNDQFISVLTSYYLTPEGTKYHLTLDYPVTESSLESGDYYILVRAEDETDFKNEYIKIHLTAIPLEFEKLIVLTQSSPSFINVSSLNLNGQIDSLLVVNSDYSSSEADSENRMLFIAGINLYDLTSINLDEKEIEWQRSAFPPLPMHAPDCICFDEYLYVSYATHFIYGFRYNGSMVFNTTIEENKLPSRIMKFREYLLADLQSKTGGFNYLATYYLATGAERQRMQTSYSVVDFHDTGEKNVLVVANNNEGGMIGLFDPNDNFQTLLLELPEEIIFSMKITDEEYMIGTSGTNYQFNLNTLALNEVLNGMAFTRMKYEPLSNKIFSAGDKELYVISYPEMQIQNTVLFPDSILNLHLFYIR